MSHTCNVEEDGLVGDIDKSQVRNLYTTAGHQVLRAGADLFTALSYVETLDFEDGTDDLQECADRLDKAVGNLEEATDLMAGGLPLVEEVETHFRAFDYRAIRAQAEIQDLFLDDEEMWETLTSHAKQANVLAGPRLYTSMVTELVEQVRGFIDEIESGRSDGHLLRLSWSMLTQFSRTLNAGSMLSYYNRETRVPKSTGDLPGRDSLEAGELLHSDD